MKGIIFLILLVVSFSRSSQDEDKGCYPNPCFHGQFFCTHSGTACCNLDSEFCSPETKECERALYDVAEGDEIVACCTFLTEEKGDDADYQRGSFKEGKLQVCKYLLGALTWERTCANLDIGTTAQPESTTAQPEQISESSESDDHGSSGNEHGLLVAILVILILQLIIIVGHLVYAITLFEGRLISILEGRVISMLERRVISMLEERVISMLEKKLNTPGYSNNAGEPGSDQDSPRKAIRVTQDLPARKGNIQEESAPSRTAAEERDPMIQDGSRSYDRH